MNPNNIEPDALVTVREFVARHPNLGSEASLRWQLFCSSQNGLDEAGAIVRRGRRVFIVVPRYVDWITGKPKHGA